MLIGLQQLLVQTEQKLGEDEREGRVRSARATAFVQNATVSGGGKEEGKTRGRRGRGSEGRV